MSRTESRADERLVSLDAYRGFVMICLAAGGFGIASAAKSEALKESPFWQRLGFQFEHVPWTGCAFWDLIQPSFMFMVGVALPYSLAKREAAGDSLARLAGHAVFRSVVLILLGIFLISNSQEHTNWSFMNVLTQIGLGYVFLFLMARWPWPAQLTAATVILIGYWAWFAYSPLPAADFDWSSYKMPESWVYLTGFAEHWQIHTNPAAGFDRWFLNLFRAEDNPYVFNGGGYQTLNFIPSLVTMLFGVMTGSEIRESLVRPTMFVRLVVAGLVLLAAGWALDHYGYCPLVKRIWTPSWTLFSTGWTLLLLAGFYGVIDVLGFRAWSFPLVVAGMNSITLYVMSQLNTSWIKASLKRHFGDRWLTWFGEPYEPIVAACVVLLCEWLFVYWLYRQRVFLKI